ncbi:MAG: phosphoribosyl-AMP cyclohydrolase [Elusimicrobia bacterium]|nr:phosphoribosyl-AMP cyclohydrolase [Elusimicrobiota bacterium]
MSQTNIDLSGIKYDADGLVPAIAQDHKDGTILMMAYMNEESLRLTLETGRAVYWSRSRKKLWRKGEESGNVQMVKALYKDCDGDTLLIKVDQIGGAACHTGHRSCFYSERDGNGWKVISKPLFNPEEVYKK